MLKMVQESSVETVETNAVYEDDKGHKFEVMWDAYAECPRDIWDDESVSLCVLGGPRSCRLHDPAETLNTAMLELDAFHEDHGRLPTTEEWAGLCPDYWVWIGWHAVEEQRLYAVALDREAFTVDACEEFVHEYAQWADGYAFAVRPLDGCAEETISQIFADSEEDAVRQAVENGYFN